MLHLSIDLSLQILQLHDVIFKLQQLFTIITTIYSRQPFLSAFTKGQIFILIFLTLQNLIFAFRLFLQIMINSQAIELGIRLRILLNHFQKIISKNRFKNYVSINIYRKINALFHKVIIFRLILRK